MFKKTLLVSGIALAISAPAQAEQRTTAVRDNGFSYDYGQLAYDMWDIDNGWDIDVLTAEGAFALDEHLFMRGGLSFYDGDWDRGNIIDSDVDGHRFYGGIGFHTPLQQNLDFVASGDLIWDEVDYDFGEDDDLGFELRGGVRFAPAAKIELSGGLSYLDVYDDDLAVYGEGLYKVAPAVDLGARVKVGGDIDTFGVFGRYNF